MPSKNPYVYCSCVTKDFDTPNKIEIWFEYLKSVGRPCAIIKRMVWGSVLAGKPQKQTQKYSLWRTVDEEEQIDFEYIAGEHNLPKEFELIKESGNFMGRLG